MVDCPCCKAQSIFGRQRSISARDPDSFLNGFEEIALRLHTSLTYRTSDAWSRTIATEEAGAEAEAQSQPVPARGSEAKSQSSMPKDS